MSDASRPADPYEQLAAAYWNHYALSHEANDRRGRAKATASFDAWEEVERIVEAGGLRSVELVVALADGAPGQEALAYLGAGPLETLLARHWQQVLDPLEVAIRRTPSLRRALENVWWADPPAEVVDRLSKFGLRGPREGSTWS